MSLRRSAMPAGYGLPRELSDILIRNGMQATLSTDAAGQPRLVVQGHDSPVLAYNLTRQQYRDLTSWGSSFLNKRSYDTFAAIVSRDFDLPRDYVHARNVNSRVAMGLHGYRVGVGEYGREPMMTPRLAFMSGMPMGFGGGHGRGFWQVLSPFLGWTGRMQDGFHLRRMGGQLVTPQGAPIVPERPDGRMRPGELQSGGYGFYWKGGSQSTVDVVRGVAGDLVDQPFRPVIQREPPQAVARTEEPAKPYKDEITSPVYFTADKFKEVLATHGLVLDSDKKELLVQSSNVNADLTYSVSDGNLAVLMDNSLSAHSLEDRLKVLNGILGQDFKDPVTMDMLNSRERIPIALNDEATAELREIIAIRDEEVPRPLSAEYAAEVRKTVQADGLVIPLVSEKEGYHWEQDARHGRDVVLGNVVAYEDQGRFFLRADVNGEEFTKNLTEKEFQEIHYRNDSRRLELVDRHLDGIHLEKGDYQGEVVNTSVTHGDELDDVSRGNKGWYREGRDGREVTVGDISVAKQGAKFIMTAEIDGETISHEISQKDFNRFLQMDDYHRMKLFSKIFDEVDIKNNVSVGTRVGAAIVATLTVMGEMGGPSEPLVAMPRGELRGAGPRPYFKPGVDSPMDIAARNFEAAMVTEQMRRGL